MRILAGIDSMFGNGKTSGMAMIDHEQARTNMVDCQIRPNDVTSFAVIEVFGSVPREEFVPARNRDLAYVDEDIAVHADVVGAYKRYLMEPMSMARLIQLASIEKDDIVLDVGCGTGYSTAILSQLCSSVVAVESDETLASQASENLTSLNYDNAVVVTGALEDGYPSEGPYDVIFVGGAVGAVSAPLMEQLKEGGRLVVVEGSGNCGNACIYTNSDGLVSGRTVFNCAVKPLPGFELEEHFEF